MKGGMPVTIQEKIKSLMAIRGWSEYRLTKVSDLPQSTISYLFKRSNAPSFHTLDAICQAFGITLSQFFAEQGKPVTLTAEQRDVLLLWGSLSEEQRSLILSTMKHLGDS